MNRPSESQGDEFPQLLWEFPPAEPARVGTYLPRAIHGYQTREVWYGREIVRW